MEGNTRAGLTYSETGRFLVLLLARPDQKKVRFFLNYLSLLSFTYIFSLSGPVTSHFPVYSLPRGGAFPAPVSHIPSPHTTSSC